MPTIPRSSAEYYRRQQRIIAALLLAVRRTWRRMQPQANWQEQYEEDGVGAQLLLLVTAAQIAAARDADRYMADVLNELAFGPEVEPGVLIPRNFAGVAGDGRPVETLLAQSVAQAGQRYNRLLQAATEPVEGDLPLPPRGSVDPVLYDSLRRSGETQLRASRERIAAAAADQALTDTDRWLQGVVSTILIDTARAAEAAAAAPREWVDGWVRMLNPPSCSRCAVLAGRFYLWNDGFERHPLCDCRHIPASENLAKDLTTDPSLYFDSLAPEDQDRIFTKAGAEAIRDGADIGQVVNARRGMATAQQNPRGWIPKGRMVRQEVFGRDLFTTDEGATRHGIFGRINAERRAQGKPALPVRLMPESIYELAAGDRTEAIRLLRLHGYIL